MGSDKALLPHPAGGCWLDHSLRQLAALGAPLTLLSGHASHLSRASQLAASLAVPLELLHEPSPPQGPLIALGRLMRHHPNQLLLLCPVDMPALDLATLRQLLQAASSADSSQSSQTDLSQADSSQSSQTDLSQADSSQPSLIHVAHDGSQAQPLLGLYPADSRHRRSLEASLAGGERSLQRWLAVVGSQSVPRPAGPLLNANRPGDLDQFNRWDGS
jgi:molybdopterin-guanine dinucleotide biosynthesis protein A